jgi:energy-coupling factor transporter ATP-binding protein EcfA2
MNTQSKVSKSVTKPAAILALALLAIFALTPSLGFSFDPYGTPTGISTPAPTVSATTTPTATTAATATATSTKAPANSTESTGFVSVEPEDYLTYENVTDEIKAEIKQLALEQMETNFFVRFLRTEEEKLKIKEELEDELEKGAVIIWLDPPPKAPEPTTYFEVFKAFFGMGP